MVKVIIKRNTEKTKQRKSQVLSLSGQNQETLNNLKYNGHNKDEMKILVTIR
jgi:hypothetical protein